MTSLQSHASLYGATQSWIIHISRRTRRVAHAPVSANAWMPESADSSSARPSVRYVGGGNYQVDNLLFTKSGWWNVALTIGGRHGTDSLAFNLIIPSRQAR